MYSPLWLGMSVMAARTLVPFTVGAPASRVNATVIIPFEIVLVDRKPVFVLRAFCQNVPRTMLALKVWNAVLL